MTVFHDYLLNMILDKNNEVCELAVKILLQYSKKINQIKMIIEEVMNVQSIGRVLNVDFHCKRRGVGEERIVYYLFPLPV